MPVILTVNKSTEMKSSITIERNEYDVNFSSMHAMNVPCFMTCFIHFLNAVIFYGRKCSSMVACCTDEADIHLLCQESHWVYWRPVQPHYCSVFPQLACVFCMFSHCLECTQLINIFSKNLEIFVLFEARASGQFCLNLQRQCL